MRRITWYAYFLAWCLIAAPLSQIAAPGIVGYVGFLLASAALLLGGALSRFQVQDIHRKVRYLVLAGALLSVVVIVPSGTAAPQDVMLDVLGEPMMLASSCDGYFLQKTWCKYGAPNKGDLAKLAVGVGVVGGTAAVCALTAVIGCVAAVAVTGAGTAIDVGAAAISGDITESQLIGGFKEMGQGDVLGGLASIISSPAPSCGEAADKWQDGEQITGWDAGFCGLDAVAFAPGVGAAGKFLKASTIPKGAIALKTGTELTENGARLLLNQPRVASAVGVDVSKLGTHADEFAALSKAKFIDSSRTLTPKGMRALNQATPGQLLTANKLAATQADDLIRFSNPSKIPAAAKLPSFTKPSKQIVAKNLNANAKALKPGLNPFKSGPRVAKAAFVKQVGPEGLAKVSYFKTTTTLGRTGYLYKERNEGQFSIPPPLTPDPDEQVEYVEARLAFLKELCNHEAGTVLSVGDYSFAVTADVLNLCGTQVLDRGIAWFECLVEAEADETNIFTTSSCLHLATTEGVACTRITGLDGCSAVSGGGEAAVESVCESFGIPEEKCVEAASKGGDFFVNLFELTGTNRKPHIEGAGTYLSGVAADGDLVWRHDIQVQRESEHACGNTFLKAISQFAGHCGYAYYVEELHVQVLVDGEPNDEFSFARQDLIDAGLLGEKETLRASLPAVVLPEESHEIEWRVILDYFLEGNDVLLNDQVVVVFKEQEFHQAYEEKHSAPARTSAEGEAAGDDDGLVEGHDGTGDKCRALKGSACGTATPSQLSQGLKEVLSYWWVFVLIIGGVIVYKGGWLWRWTNGSFGKRPPGAIKTHRAPGLLSKLRGLVTGKKPAKKLRKEFLIEGVPLRAPPNKDGTGPDLKQLKKQLEDLDG